MNGNSRARSTEIGEGAGGTPGMASQPADGGNIADPRGHTPVRLEPRLLPCPFAGRPAQPAFQWETSGRLSPTTRNESNSWSVGELPIDSAQCFRLTKAVRRAQCRYVLRVRAIAKGGAALLRVVKAPGRRRSATPSPAEPAGPTARRTPGLTRPEKESNDFVKKMLRRNVALQPSVGSYGGGRVDGES